MWGGRPQRLPEKETLHTMLGGDPGRGKTSGAAAGSHTVN